MAMPRTARLAPGGVIFHVLNRANARSTIFEDEADYAAFERVMAATIEQVGMRLLAYCVMPNHWHLVLWPRGEGDLGRFMQRLTTTHVRRWHLHRHSVGSGHLYQGTYKSFPIQEDEHLLTVCRYVERNPLRVATANKLVDRAEDWRWSSLWRRLHPRTPRHPRFPQGCDDVPVLCDWPVDRQRNWVWRVNCPESVQELEMLRLSVNRGRPYGTERWQKTTAKKLGLESTFRRRGRPKGTVARRA